MDLGTMGQKVDKGRYRSIDEFREDFLLVTTNAKTFNPPSTIFHSEAAKLEKYGLDAINKAQQKLTEAELQAQALAETQAASAVAAQAEYELRHQDDLIKVESDGEGEDGMRAESMERGSRSVSAAPTPGGGATQMRLGKRRGGYRPRGAPKSLDELWKIPGPETGIGAFPRGSDFAGLMLEFEIMGRKTLTKKERIKLERHPLKRPIAPDGSIDYAEMEDPFSFLSVFLPERFGLPELDLVPAASTGNLPKQKYETPAYPSVYAPVSVPPTIISMRTAAENAPVEDEGVHWTVQRPGMNSYRSYVAREEEEMRKQAERDSQAKELEARDPAPTDWGSFGTLPMKWSIGDNTWYSDESKLHMKIREDIRKAAERLRTGKRKADAKPSDERQKELEKAAFGGEAWLRDVVYGGPEGIAYVQSVASFVDKAMKYAQEGNEETTGDSRVKIEEDIDMDDAQERPSKRRRIEQVDESVVLPTPLPEYVSDLVIDPLTSGLHEILDRIGEAIEDPDLPLPRHLPQLGKHLENSVNLVPEAEGRLSELNSVVGDQLDMGAVLRAPDEFFYKDDEWTERSKKAPAAEETNTSTPIAAANGATLSPASPAYINYGLAKAAESILRLSQAVHPAPSTSSTQTSDGTAVDAVAGSEDGEKVDNASDEDPEMRKLRLNLLTMTRHVPLAELAPLKPELIPGHVRHLFPARIGGEGE
ncbi:hypothetical protein DACRYDRAFT_83977 [Dacryopinax primogenitus]|uniref:Bromo domain-containing protein n=1 Tax=Dacryopinax primogenitus (strain DJM 731) TaxID=1858805 RepID=M5FXL0_DACPD|nr:uncharacterized protein DACRYDRAFT_83977 [Dacryopinax primogenitus]EJT98231.1 hypothetical protein DACRYDRAFT_83977 [Dacryopinax primogenitus]